LALVVDGAPQGRCCELVADDDGCIACEHVKQTLEEKTELCQIFKTFFSFTTQNDTGE